MQLVFETGRIVDLVLAVLVIEAVALHVHHRLTQRAPSLMRALPFLLAGACLLLAWRAAAAGLPWVIPALCLAGAGVAHAFDLLKRQP